MINEIHIWIISLFISPITKIIFDAADQITEESKFKNPEKVIEKALAFYDEAIKGTGSELVKKYALMRRDQFIRRWNIVLEKE